MNLIAKKLSPRRDSARREFNTLPMKCSRNITITESFFALQGIFINTRAGLGSGYHFVVIDCALRMTEQKKILHPLRRNEREATLLDDEQKRETALLE